MNETSLAILALSVLCLGLLLSTILLARRQPRTLEPTTAPGLVHPQDSRDLRAEEIIERIGEGVLVLDAELRPVLVNAAAKKMLGIRDDAVSARLASEEVLATARRVLTTGQDVDELLTIWFPLRTRLRARAAPLDETGVVVFLQDVTEEVLAQQVRKEFVAHASHELKSPVASLQTLAEAVRQAVEDDPAAAARFSERMMAEASRLGRLISDLLDLSRLEDPATVPDEPIDLSHAARWEMEQAEPTARLKSMELTGSIESDVWVKGDEQQLGLLIRNLLENAIRYTPEGGSVSLEIAREGGKAVVRVTDTGMGIPTEAQGRVFERFYRVDRARSRDRGGTGLGLAIVKHVAELHGGTVTVASELGTGSTFTAALPAIPSEGARVSSIAG